MTGIVYDVEEMKQGPLTVVICDEGPPPLLASQYVMFDQVGNCFAYRSLTDAQVPGELYFTGNDVTWRPAAITDARDKQILYLHVKRYRPVGVG